MLTLALPLASALLALEPSPAAADPRTQHPAPTPSAQLSRAIDVRAERFDELRTLLFEQQIRSHPESPKRFTDRLPLSTETSQRR